MREGHQAKMRRSKLRCSTDAKYLFLLSAIYCFFAENFIELNIVPQFSYIDELYTLVFLCFIVREILINRTKRKHLCFVFPILIMCVCAIISTALNNYQPYINDLLDLYANVKFPIAFLGTILLYAEFDMDKYANRIGNHVKFLTIVLAGLTIIDILFNAFPDPNYQFYKHGIKSLRLIYGHPATLAVVCLLLCSVLVFLQSYNIKSRKYQATLFVIMILTLRAKIIGTIAIVSLIYIIVYKYRKKITIRRLVLLAPFALVFAWGEIQSYYVENLQASRLVLTLTSIDIAKDMFPFGTGLATFGSAFSKAPYSPVYSRYGISTIWGLSESTAHDISDTFWPMLLGQFGIVAMVSFLIYIVYIYKEIQSISIKEKNAYMGCMILMVYLAVASTSESAFVNAYAVYYAMFMSVYINDSKRNSDLL